MIQRLIGCIIVTLVVIGSNIVSGRNAISVAAGHGTRGVDAYRANLQHEWSFCLNDRYQLRGYFELAGMKINSNHTFSEPSNDHVEVVSVSPVLRFYPKYILQWYLDLGIGLAYFSKDEIATRNLGSNLLFEDRFGIGALFGKKQQFEIGYRVLHYSNAYLAQVNQGLNIHLLILGYWF